MAEWKDFAEEAPRIADVFLRRHKATGNLCLLATLRSDGFPRISPMEPSIFERRLILIGMPNTRKFNDLARDPRFSLHTATIDPYVGDGDAKLWGTARNDRDTELHRRFADHLFKESGLDLRGRAIDPFYIADLAGASSVEFVDGRLTIRTWRPGEGEKSRPLA